VRYTAPTAITIEGRVLFTVGELLTGGHPKVPSIKTGFSRYLAATMFFSRKRPRGADSPSTAASAWSNEADDIPFGALELPTGPAGSPDASAASSPLHQELAELYQEIAGGLFRYGLVLTRNVSLVQDAVQEAFLKFYLQRQKEEIDGPEAWLFRVLRNYILDQQKSFTEKMSVALEEAKDCHQGNDSPEREFERSEAMEKIVEILSPRELQCLQLRTEGFSYKEIAEILAVQPGTVGALLARSSDKIRRAFSREVQPCEAR
jgi:RNA polymerase sigma-70 factor, ECF subfamily